MIPMKWFKDFFEMIVLTHLSGNYTSFNFNPSTSYPYKKHEMMLLLKTVEFCFKPSSCNFKNKFQEAKETNYFDNIVHFLKDVIISLIIQDAVSCGSPCNFHS